MEPKYVGVHEAKTHLSDLLRRIEAGEIITITRRGAPIAELRPPSAKDARPVGTLKQSWDLPSPEEIDRLFLNPDEDVARAFYGDDYDAVVEATQRFKRQQEKGEG